MEELLREGVKITLRAGLNSEEASDWRDRVRRALGEIIALGGPRADTPMGATRDPHGCEVIYAE